MSRKAILALIVLFLLILIVLNFTVTNSVDVYVDGENVSVSTWTIANINDDGLNEDICDLTLEYMNDTDCNITHLKNGIQNICSEYGLENVKVNIDSSIGENQIPLIIYVDGTSMLPTLQDGQTVLINKTHNIHVGDIVVAESDEYGGIIKRVDFIDGDSVHLISDNKNVSQEYIDGELYEVKGITTWVDISDIDGVAIEY